MSLSLNFHDRNFFIIAVLFFAAGMCTSYTFDIKSLHLILPFPLLFLLYLWTSRVQITALTSFLILALFGLSGAILAYYDAQNQPLLPIELNTSSDTVDCVIVGRLAEMITKRADQSVIIVSNPHVQFRPETPLQKLPGKLRLTVKNNTRINLIPGDLFTARTQLKKPVSYNSTGVFDYARYLAEQDIHLIGTIKSELLIQSMQDQARFPGSIQFSFQRLRHHISNSLRKISDKEAGAIYTAILTGNRSAIPCEVLDGFKHTGTMHILAISGVHMSLLGLMLFSLFHWSLRRSILLINRINVKMTALLLTIPFLALYTGIAGGNPPVIRSFIMSLFCICALYIGRIRSALNILAVSAFIVLAFHPISILSASFQLSYTAVAFILILTIPITRFIIEKLNVLPDNTSDQSWVCWPVHLISATIAATLGTAPLLIYHFNHLSFSTIFSNLLIEPLICLISLPVGFAALPLLFIHESSALSLLNVGAIPISWAIQLAGFISAIPGSYTWVPNPSIFAIVLYYLGWMALISLRSMSHKTVGFCLIGISVMTVILPFTPLKGLTTSENRVSFINVGHGSASLIEFSNGNTILIDGGSRSGPGFDVGSFVISPYLWHRGIARLDDIIITHSDADHYNGLQTVIQRFSPQRIWLPEKADPSSPTYTQLIETVLANGISILFPEKDIIYQSVNHKFSSLGRFQAPEGSNSSNDRSLVLCLESDTFSVLFPGDIEEAAEQRYIQSSSLIKPTILLSPHHGARSSNSNSFLSAVSPDHLVISASLSDLKGGKTLRTEQYAAQLGIPVFTTAQHGTIVYRWQSGTDSSNGKLFEMVEPTIY